MFKDILREQQPVVYHTLRNALEHNRLAHAYMFSGPSGTPKKETAYLLAQSLVCRESGFACEVCDTCERIAHNEYADMIYLDGTSVSIKKDDILKLQHAFAKTGLEKTGKKIYVLDHAENATPDALNSLLKFLEEPGSDMIAILIVEQHIPLSEYPLYPVERITVPCGGTGGSGGAGCLSAQQHDPPEIGNSGGFGK